METKYNNDNFEQFLKETSDQHRMYPSENVWKRIYTVLHPPKRWYGVGFLLLALSAGFVTVMMLLNTNSSDKQNLQQVVKKQMTPVQNPSSPFNLFGSETNTVTQPDKPVTWVAPASQNKTSNITTPAEDLRTNANDLTINAPVLKNELNNIPPVPGTKEFATTGHESKTQTASGAADYPVIPAYTDEVTDQAIWSVTVNPVGNNIAVNKSTASNNGIAYPMTIESVLNSFSLPHRNGRFSFRYYFSPSISYRKLSENKSFLRSMPMRSVPYNYAALYYNINNVVTHKPDMGFELGVTGVYKLNDNLKLLGGLQFNISRYDIKAFTFPPEPATIALNSGYGVDSIQTLSSYRNFNGFYSDWLHNFYFQVSAPVGAEVKLAGDDKVQLGIAGTLQPTYILGDRAYLISSDFKHYVEMPWLIRRWNINTSFHAFVAYSTGKLNWQVGPQIRYQLKSSFINKYPVKENLFDFGLKVEISPNK